MAPFAYTMRLVGPAYRRTIRIIELASGAGNAPLRCALKLVDLDDAARPPYDAISYCWDGQAATAAMECDGGGGTTTTTTTTLAITPNLADALRQLRPPAGDPPRALWADAVCVNQADVEEKSAQVPLMAAVYGRAREVEVWLGPEDDDAASALSLLAALARCARHFAQLLALPLADMADINSQRWKAAKTTRQSPPTRIWARFAASSGGPGLAASGSCRR